MNRSIFRFPSPPQPMQFDGERYTSGTEGPIQHEHYHRYLFTLRYCVDKHVLDIASGEGYGSFLLGQVARSVIGVDIDQEAVDFANQNYMSELVSFRRGDATKLPIEDQSVDVVVSFETIEHFANQGDFVAEIDRVLRPDGLVIMSSPDREIYSEAQNYHNPFHVHEMNKEEFVDLLSGRFQHVRLLDQGAVYGSLIRPLAEAYTDNVEGFTTRDGQSFEHLTGVRGAPYFIALAAHTPVPMPPVSVLHSDFYRQQAEVHSQHAKQMADVEAALRAEQTAYRKQAAIFAQREQETAARHAAEIERLQAAMAARRSEHVEQIRALQEVEAKRNNEIAESIRQLALSQTRPSPLPRKLRGVGSLFSRKKRRLANDYRLLASSPLFDRNWYLSKYPDLDAVPTPPVSVLHSDVYRQQAEGHSQHAKQMAAVEAALRAEQTAYRKQAAIFAQREQETAARHAAKIERLKRQWRLGAPNTSNRYARFRKLRPNGTTRLQN